MKNSKRKISKNRKVEKSNDRTIESSNRRTRSTRSKNRILEPKWNHGTIELSNHRTIEPPNRVQAVEKSNHLTIEKSKNRIIEVSNPVQAVEKSNHRTIEPSNRVQAVEKSNHRKIEPSNHRKIEKSKNRTIESGRERTRRRRRRATARAREMSPPSDTNRAKKNIHLARFSRASGASARPKGHASDRAARRRERACQLRLFRPFAFPPLVPSPSIVLSLQDKSRAVRQLDVSIAPPRSTVRFVELLATCLGERERENNRRRGHKRHKGKRSKKSQLARALATPRRTVASAPPPARRCAGRARKPRNMNNFVFAIRIARRRHLSRARGRAVAVSPLSPGFDGSMVRFFDFSSAWTRFDGSIFRLFDFSSAWTRFDGSIFRLFDCSIFRRFDFWTV